MYRQAPHLQYLLRVPMLVLVLRFRTFEISLFGQTSLGVHEDDLVRVFVIFSRHSQIEIFVFLFKFLRALYISFLILSFPRDTVVLF